MKNKSLTGIILAGGKSSRMGTDKAFLIYNNKTFIEHVIEALKPSVRDIIISANTAVYSSLGYKVCNDSIPNCGPLGGIYTALSNSKSEKNIVISCDMPLVNAHLIKYLIEHAQEKQVNLLAHNGDIEPLCAIYDKSCLPILKTCLKNNFLKMKNILGQLSTHEIEINNELFYHPQLMSNVNTPTELNYISNYK